MNHTWLGSNAKILLPWFSYILESVWKEEQSTEIKWVNRWFIYILFRKQKTKTVPSNCHTISLFFSKLGWKAVRSEQECFWDALPGEKGVRCGKRLLRWWDAAQNQPNLSKDFNSQSQQHKNLLPAVIVSENGFLWDQKLWGIATFSLTWCWERPCPFMSACFSHNN